MSLQVVAHPISQHFITSIVFDNIPRWRTSTMKYKIFFIVVASFCFPITSLASILAPCTTVGRLGKRPLMKFINVGASFITFLGKCTRCFFILGSRLMRNYILQGRNFKKLRTGLSSKI